MVRGEWRNSYLEDTFGKRHDFISKMWKNKREERRRKKEKVPTVQIQQKKKRWFKLRQAMKKSWRWCPDTFPPSSFFLICSYAHFTILRDPSPCYIHLYRWISQERTSLRPCLWFYGVVPFEPSSPRYVRGEALSAQLATSPSHVLVQCRFLDGWFDWLCDCLWTAGTGCGEQTGYSSRGSSFR
jgi:hypothetical protein